MNRKIAVTVSALLLATHIGSPLAAAEPTVDQLAAINGYLENNQVEELRAFLALNPDLLEGEGPLAVLLREFMTASGDLTTFFGFEPDLGDSTGGGPGGSDNALSSDGGFEPATGALY